MSWPGDYRASLTPNTAADRRDYYRAILGTLNAQDDLARIEGARTPRYDSVQFAFNRLVRAQLAFAEAQISEAARVGEASADRDEARGARP